MGRVRPFLRVDVPAVVDLHTRVLEAGEAVDPQRARYLHAFYDEALFLHPWRADDLPSLVYERDDGAVAGFLGVLPRPMSYRGRALRMAVATRFMVDPAEPRAALAAVALFKRFLQGPQELSFTDAANEDARRIWQAAGGLVMPLLSLRWSWETRRSDPGQEARTRSLSAAELLDCIETAACDRDLRPEYDEASLQWLLEFLERAEHRGALRRRAVLDSNGEPQGWCVYYSNARGYNGVLAAGSRDGQAEVVLSDLLDQAWREGTPAVRGRIDLGLLDALTGQGCALVPGPWTLAHAADREVLLALATGRAWLSGLEGEF